MESDQRPGEKRAVLNLASTDHFFRERLSAPATFSAGRVPWDYVASFLVRVAEPLAAASVTVIIEPSEAVYLTLVDSDYRPLGERLFLLAGGPRETTLPLVAGALALVIQAGEAPTGKPVTLHKAWLGSL